MVAPIRYLSRRQQEQKIGILQNTEEKKVLEVIGRVGIGTTIFDADYNLDVRGTANITGILSVGQIVSGAGNTFSDLTVTGVSTFQSAALFADGTEAEPSISFINDTDLGLYRPADNEIAFTNGGSESVRIDDQGRVGIGSTQPGSTLVVNAPSGYTGDILDVKRTGDATSAFSLSRNNVLFRGLSAGDVRFVEYNSYLFYIGVDLQFHMSNHKFSLEDEGTYAWSSTTNANGTPDLTLYRDSANVLALRGGVNGGNNGIGQTFRIYNTYTSATDFERANVGWTTNTFIVGTEKGSAGGTARQLELQTDGTTRVSITTDGSVGIGTTQPTAKLDVNGNGVISNTGASPLDLYKYATTAPTIKMYGANGNATSPSQTLDGDVIGGWNAFGYGPSGWAGGPSVRITAVATENNGTTISRGADIKFETVVNGGVTIQERMRLTNAGNLGIGTDNPSQKLDVNGNVNIRGELHGPELFIIDPSAVGDNTGAVRIKGDLYVDGDNFIIDSETITLADFVVGIASTVPSNTLLDGAGIGIGSLSPGGQHYHTFLYRFNSGNGLLQSSEHLSVANDKCYFIGSTERLCADTLSLGTGTTIHSPASNVLTFGTNGEERIRIDDQGRVGIGSTQPTQKLDVNGNVAIGGSVYDANNLPGNNGQVLSNVTGFGISWTDAPVGEVNVNDITSGSYYIGAFETTGTTSQAYIETTNPVVITSDGRIGIGSTLPTQKLDVSGSVAISNFIYDSTGSTGVPGQVLKSTVSGTEWEDETGGTGTTIGIRSDGTIVGTASTVDFYDSFNVVVNSGIASIRISDVDAGSFI